MLPAWISSESWDEEDRGKCNRILSIVAVALTPDGWVWRSFAHKLGVGISGAGPVCRDEILDWRSNRWYFSSSKNCIKYLQWWEEPSLGQEVTDSSAELWPEGMNKWGKAWHKLKHIRKARLETILKSISKPGSQVSFTEGGTSTTLKEAAAVATLWSLLMTNMRFHNDWAGSPMSRINELKPPLQMWARKKWGAYLNRHNVWLENLKTQSDLIQLHSRKDFFFFHQQDFQGTCSQLNVQLDLLFELDSQIILRINTPKLRIAQARMEMQAKPLEFDSKPQGSRGEPGNPLWVELSP